MSEKHWKEQYEDAADADLKKFSSLSLAELMLRVQRGQFGAYYVLWDAIAAKRDLPAVGWQLFAFLQSPADYLHRYHCARALLLLLENSAYEPADLTVKHRNPEQNLAEVEQILMRTIGARPV